MRLDVSTLTHKEQITMMITELIRISLQLIDPTTILSGVWLKVNSITLHSNCGSRDNYCN